MEGAAEARGGGQLCAAVAQQGGAHTTAPDWDMQLLEPGKGLIPCPGTTLGATTRSQATTAHGAQCLRVHHKQLTTGTWAATRAWASEPAAPGAVASFPHRRGEPEAQSQALGISEIFRPNLRQMKAKCAETNL